MEIERNKKLIVPNNKEVVRRHDFDRVNAQITIKQKVGVRSLIKND